MSRRATVVTASAAEPLPGTAASALKRGEDRRLRAGHLWVFSNEVDTERTPLAGLRRPASRRSCVTTATSSWATSTSIRTR